MKELFSWIGIGLASLAVIGALAYIIPTYSVWEAEQQGRAMLAKANYSKEAQVADAKAKLESAKYLQQAAEVIQSSLTPAYLNYLNIQAMEHVGEQNERAVYFYGNSAPVISVPVK
jgi:membrane-bound lytic murein transglycosylase